MLRHLNLLAALTLAGMSRNMDFLVPLLRLCHDILMGLDQPKRVGYSRKHRASASYQRLGDLEGSRVAALRQCLSGLGQVPFARSDSFVRHQAAEV